ncbi:MAG: hypothetical protein PVF96_04835 [Candidatus Bathyarchaeota archaeon]
MRYMNIGRYQVSIILIVLVLVVSPIVIAASYYVWTSRTIPFSVDEPLSITDYPASIHFHPGENKTLDITIVNIATINYSVSLTFTLNDTAYQESYVTFSNSTYNISPGTNQIMAWIAVDKNAHPIFLELIVDFYRE